MLVGEDETSPSWSVTVFRKGMEMEKIFNFKPKSELRRRIDRLIDFIASQYEAKMRFVDAIDAKKMHIRIPKGIRYKSSSMRMSYVDKKIFFSVNDPPIGFIELILEFPNKYDIQKLVALIDFVISFKEPSKELIGRLEYIEEYMRRDNKKKGDNLIFLFEKHSQKSYPIQGIDFQSYIPPSHIFVEGPSEWEIYKMALNYHKDRERASFVNYLDLDKSKRIHLKCLNSLGNTTIYIPCLETLSFSEINTLIELLENDSCSSVIGGKVVKSRTLAVYFPKNKLRERLCETRLLR